MRVRTYIGSLIFAIFATLYFLYSLFIVSGNYILQSLGEIITFPMLGNETIASIFFFVFLGLVLIAYFIVVKPYSIKKGIAYSIIAIVLRLLIVLMCFTLSPLFGVQVPFYGILGQIFEQIYMEIFSIINFETIELFSHFCFFSTCVIIFISNIFFLFAVLEASEALPFHYGVVKAIKSFAKVIFGLSIITILLSIVRYFYDYMVSIEVNDLGMLKLFESILNFTIVFVTSAFAFAFTIMSTISIVLLEPKLRKLFAIGYPAVYFGVLFVSPVFILIFYWSISILFYI